MTLRPDFAKALTWAAVLCVLVPAPRPAAAQAPDEASAEALIDRVLEAYGGRDAVMAAESYRQESILVSANGAGHARVVRISGGPSSLSVLVQYAHRSEIRILDGDEAWRGDAPTRLAAVEGPLKAAMVLQAARARIPRVLDELRADARVEEAGDEHTVLSVPLDADLLLRAVVSNDTYRVERSESVMRAGGMSMAFATEYADFREVGGVLFAFREESFASGTHTGSMSMESVEVNPEGARAKLPVHEGR